MKYKNTQKAIIIIGERESVEPYGITRDFSPKDVDNLPGIDAAVRKGYLTPYEGKDEPAPKPVSPRTAQWHTEMATGTPVRKQLPNGNVVEYVVADSDTNDSVSMSDPDSVTSLHGQTSPDYIEEGVDARQYLKDQAGKPARNASDAFDEELDKENVDADFDDEANLAENEFDRDSIQDVDEEIAKDMSQVFIKNAGGKGGQQPADVRTVVERETSAALDEVSKATRPSYDDAEVQAGAPAKVVDFLKQSFASKKWEISKSTDRPFLEEVSRITQSENVRSLAQQRIAELPPKPGAVVEPAVTEEHAA